MLAVKYFGELCIGKQINHINGNKLNNTKENLEPVTQKENIKHAFENGLEGLSKTVHRFTIDGEYIDTFSSVKIASEKTGVSTSRIYDHIRGFRLKYGEKILLPHAGGYKWSYEK